jgi:amino acid adenylation domain-containing protein
MTKVRETESTSTAAPTAASLGHSQVSKLAGGEPENAAVHRLFEAQVRRAPEATALIFGEQHLTYRELNERANRLARHLHAKGVRNETPVGVCLRRSPDVIVAMLAVVKAGGAYVPLDPDYPRARIALMLEDTRPMAIIADSACVGALPPNHANPVILDTEAQAIAANSGADLGVPVQSDNLIYIMYTSGSTGRPKGVMIEHRAVVRLVKDPGYASFDESQRFLLLAPICFDASTFEIWGPLLNGASLVVAPPQAPSLDELGDLISRFGVTTLWLTVGLFNLMIDQRPQLLRPLRQLLVGGEALSPTHCRKALAALPECKLINGYGPTESTTFAVCMTLRPADLGQAPVPIGFPIRNTQVWLLDDALNPVSKGETGELCIGGDGLARGYLNHPDLSAQRLVAPKWATEPSIRLYRTGDLARYREDGALELLGRVDDQVKISGYRIEPNEIACVLREHAGIRDAVVLADSGAGDSKRLVAYVVPRPGIAPDEASLRKYLGERLPQFMMPAAIVAVDELPLTGSGKVDRAALLRGQEPARDEYRPADAPQGELERKIAAGWKEVLHLNQVGARDNFFDLGGDSLKLLEVHARLTTQLARELPITDLFQYPSIAALVEHLSEATDTPAISDEIEERVRRQREALARRAPLSR